MHFEETTKTTVIRGFKDERSCCKNNDSYDAVLTVEYLTPTWVYVSATLSKEELGKKDWIRIQCLLRDKGVRSIDFERHGTIERIEL